MKKPQNPYICSAKPPDMIRFTLKLSSLIYFFLCSASIDAQELPLFFEKEDIKFTDAKENPLDIGFDGGKGWVVDNPDKSGINTSPKVGKIIRDVGAVHAGSAIPLNTPFDFSERNVISLKIYTTAPIGTTVMLKLEDGSFLQNSLYDQIATTTTKTGEWELLHFEFDYSTTYFNHVVLMFDFGNVGDGSESSTFYFDNIIQTSWSEILSVDETEFNLFHIAPNPASQYWNLESESTIHNVQVYDIQGKLVLELHPNAKQTQLNNSQIADGIYFSKITTSSGVGTQKLIKK